jgi:hypothetical protein
MRENMIVFSRRMKMEKSKNYGGYLTDIHTLLPMHIELVRHASNNGMLLVFIKLVETEMLLYFLQEYWVELFFIP